MARKVKLHWLAWHPTGYNDVLFRALADVPEIDLTVHYRFARLSTYPWQTPLGQGYCSRVYQSDKSPFSLDCELVKLVIKEDETIFVLAGWPGLTTKVVLLLLVALRRRFLFWTDTPGVRIVKSKSRSCRIVECTLQNRPYSLWHSFVRRLLYRLVFTNAEKVMATGETGTRALVALGCPSDKVVNLPFFVDLPPAMDCSRKAPVSLIDHPFTFISCGRLDPVKGYDLAIRALSIVRKWADVPFRFLLVGDGPARSSLKALSVSSGLRDEVKVLGWQEPDQVKHLLSQSNAFVHPSLSDAFPVAVLEAMAAGLPILGSDAAGSVVDRVESGKNGFVHPAGDVSTLAEHMVILLTEPGLSFRMGHAARLTAEEWPVTRGVSIIKKACGLNTE